MCSLCYEWQINSQPTKIHGTHGGETMDIHWRDGVGSSKGDLIRRNRHETLFGFHAKRQIYASLYIISETEPAEEWNYVLKYTWTHDMCALIMHL
jgi:hypothetical protein